MVSIGDAVIYHKIRELIVCSAQADLLFDAYQAVSVISVSRGDCRGSNAEERSGVLIGRREF
jgi:hypothetical protein